MAVPPIARTTNTYHQYHGLLHPSLQSSEKHNACTQCTLSGAPFIGSMLTTPSRRHLEVRNDCGIVDEGSHRGRIARRISCPAQVMAWADLSSPRGRTQYPYALLEPWPRSGPPPVSSARMHASIGCRARAVRTLPPACGSADSWPRSPNPHTVSPVLLVAHAYFLGPKPRLQRTALKPAPEAISKIMGGNACPARAGPLAGPNFPSEDRDLPYCANFPVRNRPTVRQN